MTDSFVRRRLAIAIRLSQNGAASGNQPINFAGTGSDVITLDGKRASVRVQNSGGMAGSTASITIYGLAQSVMNQLSTLGMRIQQVPGNLVTVAAGIEGGAMTTVYGGIIMQAYGDYAAQPDVSFKLECQATGSAQAIPFPASSFTGETDVVTILSGIARQLGYGFENNGVSGLSLANPYFSGSARDQVHKVCEAVKIRYVFDNRVLAIWPQYGSRNSPAGIPLISKETGMIGYPTFTTEGILVKTVFDPRITFGASIKVRSDVFTEQALQRIQSTDSVWNIFRLDHALDAEMPRGLWESSIYAYNPRFPAPVPSQVAT